MDEKLTNITTIAEFLLVGFTDDSVLQGLYVPLLLLIYLTALTGNLLIIILIKTDQRLQSPMYFFLKNLSLIDICYISVTVPKSIINSLTKSHSISFLGCASQIFLFIFLAGTEYALLIVMSYDRYVAICHPLYYEATMNRGTCLQMVTTSWASGCVYGSIHVAGTFSVRFCGPYIVHQFFCDIPSVLTLVCPGEQILEYAFIITSCTFVSVCFLFLIASYIYIFSAVLRIPSAQGRFKTYSTCIPHLTVVILFVFSGIANYLGTNYNSVSSLNLFMSVLYSVLPPSLNPLIYSLRNKDMKAALGKMLGGKMLPKT
ncbi:putative olfactory receptor 14L1 [Moschus berezovskii]|uniref:putative olfactory receptor 14L1 n=1 Tax=Moschus berezovskii TaxID=68408 RepID=UPI002444AF3C|nr:putative olfactory receptor 14L1 [Moschus berezovskii]